MNVQSNLLKLCLFATGLSGIVAEYLLATLASYFLSDSNFQWAMIISVMLFSMGLGSRLSKNIKHKLLQRFILIEFSLSILVAYSSLLTYSTAAYTGYTGIIIYGMSIAIGILIGMEIPLVVRLNNRFEVLRVNIASVIEQDYYGSLIGGLLFSFFALPVLGLTYTPFALGAVNFLVAILLLSVLWPSIKNDFKGNAIYLSLFVSILIIFGSVIAKPVVNYSEQRKYKDKVIFSKQTKYQRIVITQWKNDYWLYINGNQQLSTLDEVMYHEPLVHPAMKLAPHPKNILILGGGDGCAAREVLKYESVETIRLIDLDPAMTDIGISHPVFKSLNNNALNNQKVEVVNKDAYTWLEQDTSFYDIMIIDFPDPKTADLGRLYSKEFYSMCYRHLRSHGIIVTQAGSPYFATKAFLCIEKTIESVGFATEIIHNQIITLGEWGWVIGMKHPHSKNLKPVLQKLKFDGIDVKWINNEAMFLMTSFGKTIYPNLPHIDTIEVNTLYNPVLYKYYLKGNWDLY